MYRLQQLSILLLLGSVSFSGFCNSVGIILHQKKILAPTKDYLFVINSFKNKIFIVDPSEDQVVDSISVGQKPIGGILASNLGRLFVSNSGSDTVSVLDIGTRSVSRELQTGGRPMGMAYERESGRLFVYNTADKSVSVYSANSLQLENNFEDTMIEPDEGYLVKLSDDRQYLDIIGMHDLATIRSVPLPDQVADFAVVDENDRCFVAASGSPNIYLINMEYGQVIKRLSLATIPRRIALTYSGRSLAVQTQNEGEYEYIDLSTGDSQPLSAADIRFKLDSAGPFGRIPDTY